LERQFQRYAYDLYQQYDAAYNLTLGNEFGFNYFIYQGGLVEDSRDFCAAHNNKVWSKEEAEKWSEWTPAEGIYPEGYEVKAKNIYEVPSYMNYIGYDPLIDRGGFNCRHSLGWIADDIAVDMRSKVMSVDELMTKAEEVGSDVDEFGHKLADKFNGFTTKVNYKSMESITRKVRDELGGSVPMIKDSVRNTVVMSKENISKAIRYLESNKSRFNITGIKVQTAEKYFGYSGVIINRRAVNGIITETQLNTAKMIYAKESPVAAKQIIGESNWNKIKESVGIEGGKGHKYYEEWRSLDKVKDALQRTEIAKLQSEYYSHFQ
jgi:hypothetical protein